MSFGAMGRGERLTAAELAVVTRFLDLIQNVWFLVEQPCCEACIERAKPLIRLIERESRRSRSMLSNERETSALPFLDAIASSIERFNQYERTVTPDVERRTPWRAGGRDEYMGVVYAVQEEVARNVLQLMRLAGRGQVPDSILRLVRDPSWEEAERTRKAALAEAEQVRRQRNLDQVRDEERRHQVNIARRRSDATRRLTNAIRRGDGAAVKALLARGANARGVDEDGRTMRELAEAKGDASILQMIIRALG